VGQGTVSGQISVGSRIDLQVRLAAVSVAYCGNGVLDPGEECDDGNRVSGDGCSISCKLEPAFGHADGSSSGDSGSSSAQDLLTGAEPFVQVALGRQNTCGLRSNSGLWCWGSNEKGQLRLGSTSNRLTPALVAGSGWAQVACGQTHCCGVRRDGTLSCWGFNGSGQLGAIPAGNAGAEVPGDPWQSVAAGMYQSCAIKKDGSLWCWGDNGNGQLGTGTGNTDPVASPTLVAGDGWNQVSTGYLHTCAVKLDGTLWCWGMNANLQLADPLVQFSMSPRQVGKAIDWIQVTTGLYHTCALKKDATLWCWGANISGQLGNGTIPMLLSAQTAEPIQVTGTTWKNVSAGQSHTCATMLDGSLWCWGDNSKGQLGDKTTEAKGTPVSVVVSGKTWVAVAGGALHSCALDMDGWLWCWGDNSAGQLGIGSNDLRSSPARVAQ
jgi:cysteine-rich repeat protein